MLKPRIRNVSAVFFDMDGTLIDSETLTGPSVASLCHELGVNNVEIDPTLLYGLAWVDIEQILLEHHPQLRGQADIPARLQQILHDMLRDRPPPLIRNSREAVIAASRAMPVAIISSSGRESIEATIHRMDIAANVSYYAGFEDYDRCKPEPDGYLQAAQTLEVDAGDCLVFEDSVVGIQAAKRAGMRVVAITHRCHDIETASELADLAIKDYSLLDEGFFGSARRATAADHTSRGDDP